MENNPYKIDVKIIQSFKTEDYTEYEDTASDTISRMLEAGKNKVNNTFTVRDRRNVQ